MRVHFTYQNPAGCIYHVRVDNVASWADEPYPPGGFLRVMRDADGRMLAGPHVDELISWAVQYADEPTLDAPETLPAGAMRSSVYGPHQLAASRLG